MGEVKEPYEGGTGSLLEIVDMMCDVTESWQTSSENRLS